MDHRKTATHGGSAAITPAPTWDGYLFAVSGATKRKTAKEIADLFTPQIIGHKPLGFQWKCQKTLKKNPKAVS